MIQQGILALKYIYGLSQGTVFEVFLINVLNLQNM